MPHAVDELRPAVSNADAADEDLIAGLLNDSENPNGQGFSADLLNPDRELDNSNALSDAEDFADIGSDEDLPDEEDAPNSRVNGHKGDVANDFLEDLLPGENGQEDQNEGDGAFDDLFGDEGMDEEDETEAAPRRSSGTEEDQTIKKETQRRDQFTPETSPDEDLAVKATEAAAPEEAAIPETAEEREQRLLFEQARRGYQRREGAPGDDIPAPPETDAELLATIWPDYNRDEIPKWNALFPGKRAYYLHKEPLKAPKPIQPTKVNLELEVDSERLFRNTTGTHLGKRTREESAADGIIVCLADAAQNQRTYDDWMDVESLHDEELVGNLSVGDLRVLCEDWDNSSQGEGFEDDDGGLRMLVIQAEDGGQPTKRTKVEAQDILQGGIEEDLPSLDDPAALTANLSRRPLLELRDPNLLLDFSADAVKQRKPKWEDAKRAGAGSFTKQIQARWNISNDKEYDLLKENQSHRVRSNLTKVEIKHSMPAQKLQYPFYKVALSSREARSFHRPNMRFKEGQLIRFEKINRIKRQNLKDKPVEEVFAEAKDMSFGDNSNMLLLEYSEEAPFVLSNFGMNSRLINYYRRKDADDSSRPKREIGETQVLLPQDSSPFSIFGFVDPGEVCPTIHNEMYRAPVFKHDPKSTDFLVVRSETGVHGAKWHLRGIENLHVVGQQFPYVEVPGTHSRKVTDASKTRIKMLSFRIYRHNEQRGVRKPWLSHDMIIKHAPGTDIPQNRSKMKEWMSYDSETKSWYPKAGEGVPDELTVRSWITPEQLCLLDSMQVGHRHLQDAGYIHDDDDGDEKEGQSLEELLAPWQVTKNFLKACQGNAMVQLHGEGDPTGRGEAFSFVKTSMKGGYKAIGESIEDTIAAQKEAQLGGHKYNVARQAQLYNDGIRRIWDAQQRSLSSDVLHDGDFLDDVDDEPENRQYPAQTPRSQVGTPAGMTSRSRLDDDSASQFSKFSATDQGRRVLQITRTVNTYGDKREEPVLITDPKVIKEYLRRRKQKELAELSLESLRPTGNAEFDAAQRKKLEEELARLQRNKERRHVREKMKSRKSGAHNNNIPQTPAGDEGGDPGSPATAAAGPSGSGNKSSGTQGTQRKCANCGMVGHIKTNKKLCPMLNGQWAAEQGAKMLQSAAGGDSAGV